jgi:hypothetical protein
MEFRKNDFWHSKGKAVPQHTYGGKEEERRYSSYSFTTSALEGGEWSASRPGRADPLILYKSFHFLKSEPFSSAFPSSAEANQSCYMPWWCLGEDLLSPQAPPWREWSVSCPGRTLPQGKDPRYPLYRRLARPQSQSGHRG